MLKINVLALGRFLGRDPFPGLPTLPQTLNPYAYALNNPVNLVDPSGQFPLLPFLIAAGAGAFIGGMNAGLGYTPMNPCVGLLQDADFWRAVAIGAAAGAAAGLASALLPALLPVASLGFWGTVGVGALSGAMGGAAGQLVYNQWTGAPLMDNVGWAALSGAVAGAAFSAVGYGLRQWLAPKPIGWTGKVGETALKRLGGQSQVRFETSLGNRYVDQLVDRVAHESKVGYVTLEPSIQQQIAKDVELMAVGRIDESVWHFFSSPVTRKVGPSGPLADALKNAGIKIVIH